MNGLPQLPLPPPRQCAHVVADIQQHLRNWYPTIGLTGPESLARVQSLAIGQLVSCMYPTASSVRITVLAEWAALLALFDDALDDAEVGQNERFATRFADTIAAVVTDVPPHGPPVNAAVPCVRALEQLWPRTVNGMPRHWGERLLTDLLDHVYSGRRQAQVNSSGVPMTEAAYLSHRLRSSGARIFEDLVEAHTRRAMSRVLAASPEVIEMRDTANYVMSLSNDLLSAQKEQADGDLNNYLTVVGHHRGISHHAARDLTGLLMREYFDRFVEMADRAHAIVELSQHDRRALADQVDGLQSLMSGLRGWMLEVTRYRATPAPPNEGSH